MYNREMTENAKSNKESNAIRPGGSRRVGASRFTPRSTRLLGSDSDSTPPVSPKRAERRPLRVEFALMEDEEKSGSVNNSDTDLDFAGVKPGNSRLRNPRLSLLGKPLNYRQHKRDVRYRRLQTRIYNFLERPKAWLAWWYHLAV